MTLDIKYKNTETIVCINAIMFSSDNRTLIKANTTIDEHYSLSMFFEPITRNRLPTTALRISAIVFAYNTQIFIRILPQLFKMHVFNAPSYRIQS